MHIDLVNHGLIVGGVLLALLLLTLNFIRHRTVPAAAASLLVLIALSLVGGPLLHLLTIGTKHSYFHIFHHVIEAVNVVSLPIVGILLLYMAIYVYYRRRLAVISSAILCAALLIYLPFFYTQGQATPLITALLIIYLVTIIVRYRQFQVKNSLEGVTPYLIRIGTVAFCSFLYGFFVFLLFGPPLFHTRFSLVDSAALTLDGLTIFSGTIADPTKLGELFIASLGGIGIVLLILLLEVLFRPLRLKVFTAQHPDRAKAASIIERSSRSSEDFFKLWPEDKHYFFSPSEQSFLAYKQSGKTVVVLGDPTGEPVEFEKLIEHFHQYCLSLGWLVAVVNATEAAQSLYEQHALTPLFIGHEGIVSVAHFMDSTRTNKHFRYVTNKAKREHLSVVEWSELTNEQYHQLAHISHAWLTRGKRREYTFFMGYFDRSYIERSRIFVLLQGDQAIGYVNLIPSYYEGHASIDQFRSIPDTSSIGMHFLMMSLITTLHSEGIKTVNIGLAPLSGIEKSQIDLLPRAVLGLVRRLGSPYYSFQGLEQFKNKFEPVWEARFLLYSGPATALLRISRDVEHASAFITRGNRSIYISTIAGFIVLTIGLFFLLN